MDSEFTHSAASGSIDRLVRRYWIREYKCPECGDFEVIHTHEPLKEHCSWCGAKVQYIKTMKEGELKAPNDQDQAHDEAKPNSTEGAKA